MSTTRADIRTAVFGRISGNAPGNAIPVAYSGVTHAPAGNFHLRVNLDYTRAAIAAMGSSQLRIDGQVVIAVLARMDRAADQGTQTLDSYVDAICDLFPAALSVPAGSSNLRFRAPQAEAEQYDVESWVFRIVRCPFILFT